MPRGTHPNSKANLRPARPGEVRNPQGINRKRPFTDRDYQWSEEVLPEKLRARINRILETEVLLEGAMWADANAVRQLIEAVLKGSTAAAKELREAVEGKSPQRLDISGPERKEMTIRVVYANRPGSPSRRNEVHLPGQHALP